jgi:hypothetical protein
MEDAMGHLILNQKFSQADAPSNYTEQILVTKHNNSSAERGHFPFWG